MYGIRAAILKMLVRVANREDPGLILVCAVYLGYFDRQLVYKMLEHLPHDSLAYRPWVQGKLLLLNQTFL